MESEILKKIYQYCAYQDRSTAEVRKKLTEWDVSREEQENIIAHLEAERFLDEERFTRSFVRGKFFHKSWGRTKIRHELRLRTIPAAVIERVMNQEIPPETYQQTIETLITRKRSEYRSDSPEKQKEKIFRFLLQKGFESAYILPVLHADADDD
ncbi:MAG: regulatory protein RecX [Bacteroidia bacterium]